jgi:O-antigen ligase
MIWLLGGYMWLYVHRPFEIWPALSPFQIERAYMVIMILFWLVYPGKTFRFNRLHLAIALFSAALGVTWFLSPYAEQPGCSEVVENYAKVAVFYVLFVTTVRDEKGLRLVLLMFLGAVSVYIAHSTLEFLQGRYMWRMGIRRMVGVDTTFGDPNAFASTLLYSVPLVIPFWVERPRRIPTILMVGYLLTVAGCILLTGSRAGFVALGILCCILIVGAARHKAQAVMLLGLAGVVGFAVLCVALPGEMQNRYLTIVDSSVGPANAEESAQGRIAGIKLGFQLFQESPLVGYGPGSFIHATKKGLQAHNLVGQCLSEMGLAGIISLGLLLICFFLNGREARRLALADPLRPPGNNFVYQVSRAVGLNVFLLVLMGGAGHNLFRYNWQWFAAFSAVSLACLRVRAAAELQRYYAPESFGLGPV